MTEPSLSRDVADWIKDHTHAELWETIHKLQERVARLEDTKCHEIPELEARVAALEAAVRVLAGARVTVIEPPEDDAMAPGDFP